MDTRYRHEWKHEINKAQMMAIRSRISTVAKTDPHAIDGKYMIRSLYFDNISDKALREKIDGINMREKFRIRYYNAFFASHAIRRATSKILVSVKTTIPPSGPGSIW